MRYNDDTPTISSKIKYEKVHLDDLYGKIHNRWRWTFFSTYRGHTSGMTLAEVGRILRESGLKAPLETCYILSWCAITDMVNVRRAIRTYGDADIIEPRDRWTISCRDTDFIDDNVRYQPLKLNELLNRC
jgi:hypothetical protein